MPIQFVWVIMDIRLLEDAIALLEEGNLSRAAARRNVTQPAFSRRIRSLEHWAGIPLLERSANSVSIHPGLKNNAADIRAVLERLNALRQRLRDGVSGPGRIVLATQHALAGAVAPQIYASLRDQRAPSPTLRLRTMNREDCITYFVHGDADIVMIYEARGLPPLPFDDTIRRKVWMRDALVPVCGGRLRHMLGPDGRLIRSVPLIGYPADSHFGRMLARDDTDADLRADGAVLAIETAFTVAALRFAEEGMGVAWVPHSLCVNQLTSGKLVNLGEKYGFVSLDVSLFFATSNPHADLLSELG